MRAAFIVLAVVVGSCLASQQSCDAPALVSTNGSNLEWRDAPPPQWYSNATQSGIVLSYPWECSNAANASQSTVNAARLSLGTCTTGWWSESALGNNNNNSHTIPVQGATLARPLRAEVLYPPLASCGSVRVALQDLSGPFPSSLLSGCDFAVSNWTDYGNEIVYLQYTALLSLSRNITVESDGGRISELRIMTVEQTMVLNVPYEIAVGNQQEQNVTVNSSSSWAGGAMATLTYEIVKDGTGRRSGASSHPAAGIVCVVVFLVTVALM